MEADYLFCFFLFSFFYSLSLPLSLSPFFSFVSPPLPLLLLRNEQTNCDCCPTMLGLAQVTVTVKRARGLWGDQYHETDGFVYIALASKNIQTRVIHNNNNPTWNSEFPFGTIRLSSDTKMRLEVWDEDKMWYKWWNDKLGECTINPVSGFHDEICPLSHGNLYYSYKVELNGPY
uniref:C2 domain-containing protein n=1 Tax=Paramormyrops kingsleyae TaxID=1676925 RepID=A0A3B3RCM5_9TELE